MCKIILKKKKSKRNKQVIDRWILVIGILVVVFSVNLLVINHAFAESLDYTAGTDDFSVPAGQASTFHPRGVAVIPGAANTGMTYVMNGSGTIYRYDTSVSGTSMDNSFTPLTPTLSFVDQVSSTNNSTYGGTTQNAQPTGAIAVDSNGNIYVPMYAQITSGGDFWDDGCGGTGNYDLYFGAINIYNSSGSLLVTIDVNQVTDSGTGRKSLGVAVRATDANNITLYASDYFSQKVNKYTTTTGVTGFSAPVAAVTSGLSLPQGIALDATGTNLFVTDTNNNAVKKYTVASFPTATPSATLTTDGTTTLLNPVGVATDASGNVHVADTGRNRILKATSGLVFSSKSVAAMNAPRGIAIGGGTGSNVGKVFVSDYANNLVKRFTVNAGGGDSTAPAAISNLATSSPTSSSITLTWTSPGDDNSTGTATTYDIRYSTSAITAGNFASATAVSSPPAPAIAGTVQTKIVTGLSPSTTYYFAIKTADEVPNWSAISNLPAGAATSAAADSTAPAAISNLATSSPTSSSITLTWTSPGDDNSTGTATTYDIRYSTSAITAGNFASATAVSSPPAPAIAGTVQTKIVTGLSPSTTYYFAIKTADEVPNWSAISNLPAGVATSAVASGYSITTSPGSNGSITCTPSSGIASGGSSSCDVIPSTNYYIANITIDGIQIGGGLKTSTYTYAFSNITANHSIAATFAATSTLLSQSVYKSTIQSLAPTDLGFAVTTGANVPAGTIEEFRVRSCSSSDETTCDGAKPWMTCGLVSTSAGATPIQLLAQALSSGSSCLTKGDTYVQYQVSLATTNTSAVPTFGPVTIANVSGQSTAWQTLISSPFDSGNDYTAISNLAWTLGAGTNTNVKFQMRTAPMKADGSGPDWANGSGWCGPGDATKCSQSSGGGTIEYSGGINSRPQGVTYDNNGYIWVANYNASTVSKININTGTETDISIPASGPFDVAYDNNGYIWVANSLTNNVSKINIYTEQKVNDYVAGSSPIGIAYDNNGYMWVANYGSNTVSKIDINTGAKAVTDIPVDSSPEDIAYDNNGYMWVTSFGLNKVDKVSTSSNSKVAATAVGSSPFGVAYDNNGYIWVANNGSGTVSKIDINSAANIGNYSVGSSSPFGLAYDNNGYIWVANNTGSAVSKVDIANPNSRVDYPTGSGPRGVAYDGNGNIWVANYSSSTVSKINTANPLQAYYSASGTAANTAQDATVRTGHRWVQYAIFMQSSDGSSAPKPVQSVTTSFTYNAPPTINVTSLAQVQSGNDATKVQSQYTITDPDYSNGETGNNTNNATVGLFYQPTNINLQSLTGGNVVTSGTIGSVQSYTVPSDGSVQSIKIDAAGAGGAGVSGGNGGFSTGILQVTPGKTYYFAVGGSNGYGGGGSGGSGSPAGGNGGGMTWFSDQNSFSQTSVIMVAGGGGGANYTGDYGGSGGGSSALDGTGWTGATGGSGVVGGGRGGNGAISGGNPGTNGSAGQGGSGGSGSGGRGGNGGGGGFGGGGGGGGGGSGGRGGTGGGGSGYVSQSLTAASTNYGTGSAAQTNGSITITPISKVTINNQNNLPIPTKGMLLVDSELVKFANGLNKGDGTSTFDLVQRGACFDDPNPASGSSYAGSYCTTQTAHSANAQVYFKATQTAFYDNGVAGTAVVTTNGTNHSILWDARNETNLINSSNAATSLNNSVWNGWNFKVAANDGGYGTNTGLSTSSTYNLDYQVPTIAALYSNMSPTRNIANNAYINNSSIHLNLSEALQTGGTITFVGGGNTYTGTIAANSTSQDISIAGIPTTKTAYTVTVSGYDSAGNAISSGNSFTNVTFDQDAPTISSIGALNPNQSFSLGAKVKIKLNASEPVSMPNAGAFTMTMSNGKICTSDIIPVGSETNSPTCTYIVGNGDDTNNLYVSSMSAIAANSIFDQAGNALTVTFTLNDAVNGTKTEHLIIDTVDQERLKGSVKMKGNVTVNDSWLAPGATCVPANNQCRNMQCLADGVGGYKCGGVCLGVNTVAYNGDTYGTVAIGTQCWLNSNLRSSKKPDGTGLSLGSDYYCYTGDTNCASPSGSVYGALYTWHAAMNVAQTYDSSSLNATANWQGICPSGWHIPSDAEQYTLENYLKDSGQTCSATRSTYDCSSAGTKLKTGGSSGFNFPLSGYYNGTYGGRGTQGYLWSTLESTSAQVFTRALSSTNAGVLRDSSNGKGFGLSVRCIKN